MSVLVLRLAGPLQSWGSASRFTRRATEDAPTKSGILGLLAAAQGRRRCDSIEDLLDLKLAVRTDQRGSLLRDFHTAHHQITGVSMPLTERFYLSDAVYTAFIGGPRGVVEGLADALRDPAYPIYLGRRSCVPEGRIVLSVDECPIPESVRSCPWQAGVSAKRRFRGQTMVRLRVQADDSVYPELPPHREINDVPVSFDPEHRQYLSRMVVDTSVEVLTGFDAPRPAGLGGHDPMALLEGNS